MYEESWQCSCSRIMTPNPECTTIDTSIVDALHVMHYGKFLHLSVIDWGKETKWFTSYDWDKETKTFLCSLCVFEFLFWIVAEGCNVACMDILMLTHADVPMV